MNSFKSFCSFAKSTPLLFDQIEKDVEALLGRQAGVILIVGGLGFFEASEDLNDPFHVLDFTM